MRSAQKFILWGSGLLLSVDLIAIGLSWWHFGSLEWQTVWEMALVTLPPLAVAAGSYFLLGVEAGSAPRKQTVREHDIRRMGVPHASH